MDANQDKNTIDVVEVGGVSELVINQLGSHIRSVVDEYETDKSNINEELETCKRQARSEYSATEIANYKKAGVGCTDYQPLTENKINVAHSLLFDVISQGGGRAWMLEPTPEPDLPEDAIAEITNKSMEMLQGWINEGLQIRVEDAYQLGKDMRQEMRNLLDKEAKQKAERMQLKMDDQIAEGGFWDAIESVAKDFCTYPASFLRAAERMERRARFEKGKLEEKDEVIIQWERVSPFNVLPSRNTKKLDDDSLVMKVSYSRAELDSLKSTDGYDADKIDLALTNYGRSGLVERALNDSDNVEASRYDDSDKEQTGYISGGIIEGYEYWGSCPGIMLKEWGMKKEIEDNAEYAIHAILIGDYIIFAQLNTNPMQRKLFYTASYEEDPDSIWGGSLPRKMRSPQRGINSARRSLSNNMALCSGPQVIVDINTLAPGCNPTEVYPFKTWLTDSSGNALYGTKSKPVDFFQPDANLNQIMPVMEQFRKEADDFSGLPRYTQGDSEGAMVGAAKTATGLSMLMNAQSKTFKKVIANFDKGFIKKPLEDLYYKNLVDPEIDDDAKGDMRIVTKGILGMSLHEQLQLRRQEFLQMVLSSEVLMEIVKPEGLVKLLREVVKTLDMTEESMLPTDSKLEQMEQGVEQNKAMNGVVELLKASVENGLISQEQFQMIISLLTDGGQGMMQQRQQLPENQEQAPQEQVPVEQGEQNVQA